VRIISSQAVEHCITLVYQVLGLVVPHDVSVFSFFKGLITIYLIFEVRVLKNISAKILYNEFDSYVNP